MLAELAPAFALGMLATLSPCALPLYPGFLAYLATHAGRLEQLYGARLLGLLVLLGVLTTMLLMGAIISAARVAVGQVLAIVTPLAYLLVILLGITMLLGRNPFASLPQLSWKGRRENPFLSAYIYGLLYGPIALPCSGPLIVALFAISLSVTGFVEQLLFFLLFGLGFGSPLLLLSLLAHSRQSWLLRLFQRHYPVVTRLGGALLLLAGVWSLTAELESFLLYFQG